MKKQPESTSLDLQSIEHGAISEGIEEVRLRTNAGDIDCRFHPALNGDAAVAWVGGANGGLNGPARGMYPRLANQLAADGIASLRLHYRRPNNLTACVLDTLLGVAYLETLGRSRVALVGHSFGGAVVITAGAVNPAIAGVAALSSQTAGTAQVGDIGPRPLLLIHGTADEVLPDRCSRDLYRRANEPRQMRLYEGCRHGLDECRDDVDRDLLAWLRGVLGSASASITS